MNDLLSLLALCPHGVEDLVAREAEEQGGLDPSPGLPGAVRFRGDQRAAYRFCLWSRCASRLLVRLETVAADSSEAFYEGVRAIDWSRHLGPDSSLSVKARLRQANAPNSHFVALKAKDAIVDRIRADTGRRPDVDLERPDARIHVFVEGAEAAVSLDLAGESLHRRGYRGATGPAPLKETLAAAVLLRAGWPAMAAEGAAFLDPLCGSGTLLLEALGMAADAAPGLTRSGFGFLAWKGHDPEIWRELLGDARRRRDAGIARVGAPFVGTDSDEEAVEAARIAAEELGFGDLARFARRELEEAEPPATAATGLLATNPPYGERIGKPEAAEELYERLGRLLRERFGGWKAAVLAAEGRHLGALGLRSYKTNRLYNGPIRVLLGVYEMRAAGS